MDSQTHVTGRKPPRFRRPLHSFRLRTLFVVVTLATAPMALIGWQWRIVQERRRLREEIEHAGGTFQPLTRFSWAVSQTGFNGWKFALLPPEPSAAEREAQYLKRSHLPFPRKWLGDESIESIILPFPYSEPHVGPIRAAFAEANIEPFRPEAH